MMELAAPIPVQPRDALLRELAGELRLRGAGDVGPGELHRLCVEVRRRIVPWDHGTRRHGFTGNSN